MAHRLHELDPVVNSAGDFRCGVDWRIGPDWAKALRDYDLWYVCGGRGWMTTSDGAIDLYPGRCLWMRPGRRYEATQDPKAFLRVIFIHFLFRKKAKLLRPDQFLPPVEVFHAASPHYLESAMMRIVERRQNPDAQAHVSLLLKSLLLEIASSPHSAEPETALQRHHKLALNPVIALIRNQPERRFTIAELAAKTGYTADHFVRLFHAATGESPKEFMIRLRIERALALLRESSHTATQIAAELGYDDLAFFSRQFKQQTGLSPAQFRRR